MRPSLVTLSYCILIANFSLAQDRPVQNRQIDDWFQPHRGSVFGLAFTTDGKTLISAGADHQIHFSSPEASEVDRQEQRRRRQLLADLDSKRFEVRQRAFAGLADLGELITEDLEKTLEAPPSNETDLRARWLLSLAATPRGAGHREEVRGVAIASDGETVASAGRDNMIGLWSVTSGRAISVINGHSDGVWCVDFSREGMQLASGGGDHAVRIWDTKTLAATHEFIGHDSTIHDVQFSSDGSFIASAGGFDHSLRIWSIESKTCTHVFDTHADAVVCLDLSSDGNTAICGDYDGSIYAWDLASGKLAQTFQAHRGVVRDVKFIPGHPRQFVSVGDDGVVKQWELSETAASQVLASTHVELCCIAFLYGAQSLVVGGRDGQIRLVEFVAKAN